MIPFRPTSEPSIDEIKKVERKAYLICLTGLGLGVLLMALVWTSKGILATIGGIAGIVLIIFALMLLGYFFDAFYRIKAKMRAEANMETYRESHITWPPWFLKWGRIALLFILGAGWKLASQHENDFGGNTFVWHSIVGGIIAGLVVYNLIRLQSPKLSGNPNMSSEIGFYIVVGFIYIFLVFGPTVNRQFAESIPVCSEHKLLEKGNKYIHIHNNGKEERFQPPRSFIENLGQRTAVMLCVKKGYLGYQYVESFKIPGGEVKTSQDNQR